MPHQKQPLASQVRGNIANSEVPRKVFLDAASAHIAHAGPSVTEPPQDEGNKPAPVPNAVADAEEETVCNIIAARVRQVRWKRHRYDE